MSETAPYEGGAATRLANDPAYAEQPIQKGDRVRMPKARMGAMGPGTVIDVYQQAPLGRTHLVHFDNSDQKIWLRHEYLEVIR
jgi:hypothetical protein